MILYFKIKEALSKGLFSYFRDGLLFFFISFISYQFYGLVFFLYTYLLFKKLDKLKDVNFNQFFFETLALNCGLILGSALWMIHIDNGFYALFALLFLYQIAFCIFFFFKKFLFVYVIVHLLLEILMNTLDISYPGIMFGNVFGNTPSLVQWYSITTVLGGSLWLLLGGLFIYKLNHSWSIKILIILIPVVCSLILFYKKPLVNDQQLSATVIDFEYMISRDRDKIIFSINKELEKSSRTETLILPEQSFRGANRDHFKKTSLYKNLNALQKENNIQTIIAGTTFYKKGQYIANGLVVIEDENAFFRIKKKLVPFTEFLPRPLQKFFKKNTFQKDFIEDEFTILNKTHYIPLVCYEAFFPFYIKSLVNDKSKIIYVLSSEQFLNNSYFGLRQYINIMKLRAIESKLPLLKAASYGPSILISPKGQVIEQSRSKHHTFKIKY